MQSLPTLIFPIGFLVWAVAFLSVLVWQALHEPNAPPCACP